MDKDAIDVDHRTGAGNAAGIGAGNEPEIMRIVVLARQKPSAFRRIEAQDSIELQFARRGTGFEDRDLIAVPLDRKSVV